MLRVFLVSLLSIIIISAAVTSTNLVNAKALLSERDPKDIIINTDLQINLVMIGDKWSEQDKGNITQRLLKTYTPTIFFENRTAGFTYNYRYNFDSVSDEIADKLFKFMDSNAVENTVPPPIQTWMDSKKPEFWGIEFPSILKKKYKMISAYQVEDWLFENLEREEGYTIYFLKPPKNKIDYFHTYGAVSADPDTRIEFVQEGMMGFGGKYRFYFIDLTAGPWIYPYVPISEDRVITQFHKNLYEVKTNEDYYNFIANYVNDAIMLLFTPSYLYSPVYKPNFRLDVFLVDMTSGRAFHDVSSNFIHRPTIVSALTQLVPYAEWSVDISGKKFDSLPRELQRAILKSLSFKKVPDGTFVVVKSEDLIIELDKWVTSTLTQEQLKLAAEKAQDTAFVPIVIFVFDTDAYVDKVPVVGTAAPNPDDKTIPCCAIVAVDKHALFDLGSGLSILAIHELGHVLGLRHPHDGHASGRGEFNNWFFDWSYTPMSYSSPLGLGCGFPNVPCGLVVSEFGQFDHDSIDRALILYLLNQVQSNLYESVIALEEKEYREGNLPSNIRSKLLSIDQDVEKSIEHFSNMNYFNHTSFTKNNLAFQMDDSFDFALRAFINSETLLKEAFILDYAKIPLGIHTVITSEPSFVDEFDNELMSVKVGEVVGIKSEVSNTINQNMTLNYLIQIKDSNDFTLFLKWIDVVVNSEVMEPTLPWTPDTSGQFKIEVFVWQNIDNPIPLSQVKSTIITVTS